MRFVGYITGVNPGLNAKLIKIRFNPVIEVPGFNLFTDSDVVKESFSYYCRNNVHILTSGYLILDGSSSIEDILENYLLDYTECFKKLDGSYTILIWDGNKRSLYINRDIYGKESLYYCSCPESSFVFSNNLDILLKTTGLKSISRKSLHEYLRFLDISPPYTIYEDIFSLAPEKILVTDGRDTVLKDIIRSNVTGRHGNISFPDAVQKLRELLYNSVKKKIGNAGNAAIFLSGGVDSTLLCAIAAGIRRDLKAFTVGFEDSRFDESYAAHDITGYLGIEHQILKFSIEDDYKAFKDFFYSVASPFADPAVIPTYQSHKHLSGSVDVVLDGTGADTLIGIMPARHIRLILKYIRHIPRGVRINISRLLSKNKKFSSYIDLLDFNDVEELLIRWKGWTKDEIPMLCNEKCDLSHTAFYRTFAENCSRKPYELYSKLIGSLPDDRVHQPAALFSIDMAFPYFDKEIQDFIGGLPLQYKYSNGSSKILFRKLLEDLDLPNLWDRPKQGFDYPFEKLLRYDNCELPKTYLSKDAINDHMFFIPVVVDRYLQDFLNGDNSVKFKIWALVVFQAWYFNYYKNL